VTDQELAEQLGIDLPTLWRWQAETESAVHVSLDHSTSDSESSGGLPPDLIASEPESTIEDDINREQEREILKNALRKLKDQERIVLTLYYFEELKLHEIGEVLDLTESRVSQIRTKALARLRTELAHFRMPA
jgi:RNA polymerase sigma factor FliA